MHPNLEVLSPAGNQKSLAAALQYGADAVYLAGKTFGMRAKATNFTLEQMEQALTSAHELGKKVYVTCNILPTNPEVGQLKEYLGQLEDIGVDALIVADIGVMMAAKRMTPNLDLHVSTQAGVVNYLTATELFHLGAKRVVLARELGLPAIAEIRENTPAELELEAFVHGSMCMAFSGRCLISHYLTGRDANHGDCAQSCRWKYHLVEEKRPGEYYPIVEDETGSYIFNANDLCMLEYLDQVIASGINSLKIEGRGKSAYYVAVTTNAYKTALELYKQDSTNFSLPEWLRAEPYKISHRKYSTGFYFGAQNAVQDTLFGNYYQSWKVAGTVVGHYENRVTIQTKNRFFVGNEVEFLLPGEEPYRLKVTDLRDQNGEEIPVARNAMSLVSFHCPQPLPLGVVVRFDGQAKQH